jgi:hypothetical protein
MSVSLSGSRSYLCKLGPYGGVEHRPARRGPLAGLCCLAGEHQGGKNRKESKSMENGYSQSVPTQAAEQGIVKRNLVLHA